MGKSKKEFNVIAFWQSIFEKEITERQSGAFNYLCKMMECVDSKSQLYLDMLACKMYLGSKLDSLGRGKKPIFN